MHATYPQSSLTNHILKKAPKTISKTDWLRPSALLPRKWFPCSNILTLVNLFLKTEIKSIFQVDKYCHLGWLTYVRMSHRLIMKYFRSSYIIKTWCRCRFYKAEGKILMIIKKMIESIICTWTCKFSIHPRSYQQFNISSECLNWQRFHRKGNIIILCRDSGKLLLNYLLSATQPAYKDYIKFLMIWAMYVNSVTLYVSLVQWSRNSNAKLR